MKFATLLTPSSVYMSRIPLSAIPQWATGKTVNPYADHTMEALYSVIVGFPGYLSIHNAEKLKLTFIAEKLKLTFTVFSIYILGHRSYLSYLF